MGRSNGGSGGDAPRCTLYCLPYAGGDTSAFWSWERLLPAGIRVVPLALPGRDGLPEAPLSVPELAARIAADLDGDPGPYALFGHSMGARLAFDVTRDLLTAGRPAPVLLAVGGAHPPHLPEPIARLAHLDEDAFIDELVRRAGTAPEVRTDRAVREALLPALRSDLHWLRSYRYRHAAPLPVPVVALAGSEDQEVAVDVVLGWARHTAATFRLHELAGDHLFPVRSPEATAAVLAAEITAAVGSAPVRPALPGPGEVHLWRHDGPGALHDVTGRYGLPSSCPGRLVTPDGPVWVAAAEDGGTALVVLAPEPVGLAVRRLRPVADPDAFFAAELTAPEWAVVAGEPEQDQLVTALRFLTRREALAGLPAAAGEPWLLPVDGGGAVATVAGRQPGHRLRFEVVAGARAGSVTGAQAASSAEARAGAPVRGQVGSAAGAQAGSSGGVPAGASTGVPTGEAP